MSEEKAVYWVLRSEWVIVSKSVDIESFAVSQHAIKDYMSWKSGNDYMHEARVLMSSRGEIK